MSFAPEMKVALPSAHLDDASAYVEILRCAMHKNVLPENPRVRVAASCFSIVNVHYRAIVVLLGVRLYAAWFALLRVAFEAYVHGLWLMECATPTEMDAFVDGREPPRVKDMIDAVVLKDVPDEGEGVQLASIRGSTWSALCGYSHTGGIHVRRWNTPAGIEPNYAIEELLAALRFTEVFSIMATVGVLTLADDLGAAEELLVHCRERMAT